MDMRDVFDSVMYEPKLYALITSNMSGEAKAYAKPKYGRYCVFSELNRIGNFTDFTEPIVRKITENERKKAMDKIYETFMADTTKCTPKPPINKDDINLVNFNDKKGTTVVKWKDGTISKVKVQLDKGDIYNPELGMAMCIAKKALGNKGNFNEVFKKWLPEENNQTDDISTELVKAAMKFAEWAKLSHGVLEANGALKKASDVVNELNESLKTVKLDSKTEK